MSFLHYGLGAINIFQRHLKEHNMYTHMAASLVNQPLSKFKLIFVPVS